MILDTFRDFFPKSVLTGNSFSFDGCRREISQNQQMKKKQKSAGINQVSNYKRNNFHSWRNQINAGQQLPTKIKAFNKSRFLRSTESLKVSFFVAFVLSEKCFEIFMGNFWRYFSAVVFILSDLCNIVRIYLFFCLRCAAFRPLNDIAW